MATHRPTVLPLALLAAATCLAMHSALVFVGGGVASQRVENPARTVALRAVPAGIVDAGIVEGSSLATSLNVSTPGMWALIVLTLVPVTFLIILYLQSERYKAENGITE